MLRYFKNIQIIVVVILGFSITIAEASGKNRIQIYIFNTKETPQSKQIVDGLNKGCGQSGAIHMYDMDGKLKKGKTLVDEIKSHIRNNPEHPKVIYSIGDPATSLVEQEGFEEKVFYSLVTPAIQTRIHKSNMHGISLRAPFINQFKQFRERVGNVQTIGIIHSEGYNNDIIAELHEAAKMVGIKLNLKMVSDNKDVPSALRESIKMNDAIMFIPDPVIINKDSYRFIIRIAIENNVPTLVYSEHLTKAGFLFALELDYHATGVLLGEKLCSASLSADMKSIVGFEPEKFVTFLNEKTLVLIGHKH
ncbi:MAG: ABC transporter substrate binding protein [Rickettsiales bacterium]|nr:ABC transporter substrate binding protein [Pseudomonadota bacterium]MDA0965655.1 ABC transporter substrate binding protein [Pseudomonadota bacterium]MDG4542979.1 ABC transporter substrate binding protein [Rickettsiales bacterium]MDG4544573.1 ABC transporter substrate binding protein [Rickettsiales bacterium]MDG4546695.1 ABC transporter substrate binding protein [Rickettsiales bacterium]